MQQLLALVGDLTNDIPSHVRGTVIAATQSEGTPAGRRRPPAAPPAPNERLVKWPVACRTAVIGSAGFFRRPNVAELQTAGCDRLLSLGMTCDEMYNAGLAIEDLERMGLKADHLLLDVQTGTGGRRPLLPLARLKHLFAVDRRWLSENLAVDADTLSGSSNSAEDYRLAGYSATDFTTLESLVNSGIPPKDLVDVLGLRRHHLTSLGPQANLCLNTGWSYGAIKQALGCSDGAMQTIGIGLVPVMPHRR